MSSTPVKRKLSAILAADAVGYSRMMGANEEATLKTLSAHRAVIDGIIEFHDGRIVGTAGDSVLAEFGSPVEAVRCAVEIQDALKTRNDSLPEDRRLQFRVGVNLGDVMVKGDDLLGDGVNVAARLESIAEPGGICISASVYDLIRGKLDLGFLDIGEQSLKNIEHPIRVYRVAREGGIPAGGVRKARRKPRPFAGAVAGLVVLAAAAAGYGYFVWLPEQRAAQQAELARAKAAAEEAAAKKAAAEQAAAEKAAAEKAAAEKAAADKAAAEVARARAEAEAAKRKAAAERAAARRAVAEKAAAEKALAQKLAAEKAAEAEKAAAVAAAPVHRYDGAWKATIVCRAFNGLPERTFLLHAKAENNAFALRHGRPGEPGFLALHGAPDGDGGLVLRGHGLSGRLSQHPGTRIRAFFEGRFDSGRYKGGGKWGKRPCTTLLSRAE